MMAGFGRAPTIELTSSPPDNTRISGMDLDPVGPQHVVFGRGAGDDDSFPVHDPSLTRIGMSIVDPILLGLYSPNGVGRATAGNDEPELLLSAGSADQRRTHHGYPRCDDTLARLDAMVR
jgi:hypothetical protein